jgi:hypothetical protein
VNAIGMKFTLPIAFSGSTCCAIAALGSAAPDLLHGLRVPLLLWLLLPFSRALDVPRLCLPLLGRECCLAASIS